MPKRKHFTRLSPVPDLLVRWVKTGEENVVSIDEVQYTGPLKKGTIVTMNCDGIPWEAKVLDAECDSFEEDCGESGNDSSDSESDLPLATIIQRTKRYKAGDCAASHNNTKESPDYNTEVMTQLPGRDDHVQVCDSFLCENEVWAACHRCNCLLCFMHFEQGEDCMYHNIAFCSYNVDVSVFDMHVVPSADNPQVSTHLSGKAAIGDVPSRQKDILMIPDEPDAIGTADLPSSVSSTENPVVPGKPEEETTAVLPCSDSSTETTMIPNCQLVGKRKADLLSSDSGKVATMIPACQPVGKTIAGLPFSDSSKETSVIPHEPDAIGIADLPSSDSGKGNPEVPSNPDLGATADVPSSDLGKKTPVIPNEPNAIGRADLPSSDSRKGNPEVPIKPNQGETADIPSSVSSNDTSVIPDRQPVGKRIADLPSSASSIETAIIPDIPVEKGIPDRPSSDSTKETPVIPRAPDTIGIADLPSSDSGEENLETHKRPDEGATANVPFSDSSKETSDQPHEKGMADPSISSEGAVASAPVTKPLLSENNAQNLQPEDFIVDGDASLPLTEKQKKPARSRNFLVKTLRNKGESYMTEKTNRNMPARRDAPFTTGCSQTCRQRNLKCSEFSLEDRKSVRNAFFDLADLHEQRSWIARHIDIKVNDKGKRLSYFLPRCHTSHEKLLVCKALFINTAGITARQIRTVVEKIQPCGVIEKEQRGGRQRSNKERDEALRQEVKNHIDRFPRVESHYCRSTSTCQYLSSDLSPAIMHKMYKTECPNGASITFYRSILESLNLKFHRPKKDLCGLCDTYVGGSATQREALQAEYELHISEKEKVRELKEEAKARAKADKEYCSAVFDLEQVLYLPKSQRSELFYKRRLANYNFTVYKLATKEGICFLSHEGQTRRGANEIASNLNRFLVEEDSKGVKTVEFFSDGCIGQNKNSVLPAMMLHFIKTSESVETIGLNFFETNHGQSEGDSMHSVIEKRMRQQTDLFLPAQLATICRMAKETQPRYKVVSVTAADIQDWKTYSQKKGILRVRSADDGTPVDWTKFKAIKVLKTEEDSIFFKTSHKEDVFHRITVLGTRRGSNAQEGEPSPEGAYESGPPRLSQGKYNDLMTLCSGPTPVIAHPDYQKFYRDLPH